MSAFAGWLIAGGIAVLWFGLVGWLIYIGLTDFDGAMPLVGGAALLLVGIGGAILIYRDAFPPAGVRTVSLRGDEWACTDRRREVHTSLVMVGKVMTPITSVSHVCAQWNRIAA